MGQSVIARSYWVSRQLSSLADNGRKLVSIRVFGFAKRAVKLGYAFLELRAIEVEITEGLDRLEEILG